MHGNGRGNEIISVADDSACESLDAGPLGDLDDVFSVHGTEMGDGRRAVVVTGIDMGDRALPVDMNTGDVEDLLPIPTPFGVGLPVSVCGTAIRQTVEIPIVKLALLPISFLLLLYATTQALW